MDKNNNLSTLLMGRADLFKVSNREVSLIARVPLAQAGAIAVAPVEDSREGARLKDKRAAPSDIAAPTTAQAASLSAEPLGPGDRFVGKISGSRWSRSDRPESGGKVRNLSEYQGFFFVQGEGLPEKGLYCPANYYRDKLVQLVLGEEDARFMTGHEGLKKLILCFNQFIGTEVTGEISAVPKGIEGRELRFDGALSWLPAEARQRMERNTSLQSLFSSSRLPGHGPPEGQRDSDAAASPAAVAPSASCLQAVSAAPRTHVGGDSAQCHAAAAAPAAVPTAAVAAQPLLDSVLGTRFKYADLVVATRNFETKLGAGGSGCVFKGALEASATQIAVKKLALAGASPHLPPHIHTPHTHQVQEKTCLEC